VLRQGICVHDYRSSTIYHFGMVVFVVECESVSPLSFRRRCYLLLLGRASSLWLW